MNSTMDNLPSEILHCIGDYLPTWAAVQLTRTSKKLHSQLSMATTYPCKFLSGFSRVDCDDDMHYGFEIPMIYPLSVHSLLVTMKWQDQGWGNRKGRLVVVAEKKNQSYDRSGSEDGRKFERVIFRSSIAKHSTRRLKIIFKPKHNESYHLWYVVGGGGGHGLELSDVKVQALTFDATNAAVKATNFLSQSNGLLPWDEKLPSSNPFRQFRRDSLTAAVLASISCLLEVGEPILPPLISYFESYGISESDLTVKFIESVEAASENWSLQRCIYQELWETAFLDDNNYDFYSGTGNEEYRNEEEDMEEDSDSDDDLSLLGPVGGDYHYDYGIVEDTDNYETGVEHRRSFFRRAGAIGRFFSSRRSRRTEDW